MSEPRGRVHLLNQYLLTDTAPTEIDNIKVGEKATVRLTALNQRTTPVLNGQVFYVSADALPVQPPQPAGPVETAELDELYTFVGHKKTAATS